MDALSEVLQAVTLAGATFVEARFTAPWSVRTRRATHAAPLLAPGADRLLIFYLLLDGEAWLALPGEPPRRLVAGQVAVLTHGLTHRLTSDLMLPWAAGARLEHVLSRRPRMLALGGGGAATRIACGYLACDPRVARRVLAALPRFICVDARASGTGRWLESSVRFALDHARSRAAGSETVLARLADVLLLETLRLHLHERQPADARSEWLASMRDRTVGAALAAMNRELTRDWTLEDLARESGTSRSVLAERFQALVGRSPIQYLIHRRMLRAAHLMRTTDAPLMRIAEDVGYLSDTTFSRAFRREFGVPPAAWRRQGERERCAAPTEAHRASSARLAG